MFSKLLIPLAELPWVFHLPPTSPGTAAPKLGAVHLAETKKVALPWVFYALYSDKYLFCNHIVLHISVCAESNPDAFLLNGYFSNRS